MSEEVKFSKAERDRLKRELGKILSSSELAALNRLLEEMDGRGRRGAGKETLEGLTRQLAAELGLSLRPDQINHITAEIRNLRHKPDPAAPMEALARDMGFRLSPEQRRILGELARKQER